MVFGVKMRWLMLVFLIVCVPIAAADGSGQFPGVYVRDGSGQDLTAEAKEKLQLKCLIAPDVMGDDGVGAGYFVDRALFDRTGQVSYVQAEEYSCRYSSETTIETCDSREITEGKSLKYYRTNVYHIFTANEQRGHSLLTPEEVLNWRSKGIVNPDQAFAYYRCSCVEPGDIEKHVSTEINVMSSADTELRRYWGLLEPTDDDFNRAQKLTSVIGKCKLELSQISGAGLPFAVP
jgi:hypothetical protein